MRVRIEAVISTAGNNEEYTGKHLGLALIGRPLKKMVVTFEDEMNVGEIEKLMLAEVHQKTIARKFQMGPNAIQLHSFKVLGAWEQ
jgi:hypothetical protein